MVAKLYYDDRGAASRSVLLTASALDLTLDLQEVDMFNKEDLTSDFIKMNPQQTVPVLVDEDLIICDGHAISGYLVSKYGNDSTLYPNDSRERALVDQRLHFDSSILLPRLHKLLFPIIMLGEKEIPKQNLDFYKEGYIYLDKFLEEKAFLTGENVTIADFSCVASISSGSVILPVSCELYPNLFKWYQKCKALPYYDKANGIGLNRLDALIETKLGSAYSKRDI